MLNAENIIPEKFRRYPVVSWLLSLVLAFSAGCTTAYFAMQNTVLMEATLRNEGLSNENQRLREDLKASKAGLSEALARGDNAISALSSSFTKSLSALTVQIEHIQDKNQMLQEELSELRNQDRRQETVQKATILHSLSSRFELNSRQITEVHKRLTETSADAGYYRSDCEKREQDGLSNICQQASRYESLVVSLREKVASLEKLGDALSAQIVALEKQK